MNTHTPCFQPPPRQGATGASKRPSQTEQGPGPQKRVNTTSMDTRARDVVVGDVWTGVVRFAVRVAADALQLRRVCRATCEAVALDTALRHVHPLAHVPAGATRGASGGGDDATRVAEFLIRTRWTAPRTVLHWAAQHGHVNVLDMRPLVLMTNTDTNSMVLAAAANGHAAVLDRLTTPPYCRYRYGNDVVAYAMALAAAGNHVAVLDRLALPPYALGRDITAAHVATRALEAAARTGSIAAMVRLALEPFCAREATSAAAVAAKHGRCAALDRLTRPPFVMLSHVGSAAFQEAARLGHADVIDRLARHPFGFGKADAQESDGAALCLAVQNGHAAVLDRLAQPPYLMGQRELAAIPFFGRYLERAASDGLAAVVVRLAEFPYFTTPFGG